MSLIAMVECESPTGQHYAELLKEVLLKLNIDSGTYVGNSTDSAANSISGFLDFSLSSLLLRFIYGVMHIL